MTEEKLSQSELQNLFGDTLPIEAVNLIWNSPNTMTIGELRKQLRSMGRDHRRLSVTAAAIRDGLSEYLVDRPEIDWFALITDVARNALKAADTVMPPSGAIFDDVSRQALVEIRNIAYNLMQGTQAQLSIPDEFRRIHERAEALLQLLDKARAP